MSVMDEGLGGLLGPAFKGLIPTNPLPARSRGSLRDSPLGDCLGAVSVQLLLCRILSLEQQGWLCPSQCCMGRTGKLQEPKRQSLSHMDPVFWEHCASLRHITMLCTQVRIKVKPVGLGDITREAGKSFGGFTSISSLQVHGHGNSQGVCLCASHALSVHACSLFQGPSPFNPTWKGKLGTSQPAQGSWFFWLKINLAKD